MAYKDGLNGAVAILHDSVKFSFDPPMEAKDYYFILFRDEMSAEIKELSTFIFMNFNQIINIIDNLYKDPLNTFIYDGDIIPFACDKLKGKNIEIPLENIAREAYENWLNIRRTLESRQDNTQQ